MKRLPFIFLFAIASVLACGPYINEVLPVETVRPADLTAYNERGELGVVRPQFARRYLVQAYRRMTGRAALPAVGRFGPEIDDRATEARKRWLEARARFGGGAAPAIDTERNIGDYQWITNCLGDAFASAAQTLTERGARDGAASPKVREWIEAQDRVFRNCREETLVLPEPPSSSADPIARADRQYQIAAAYFYAMRYDEAVQRFRAIAADQASPWRPYGHYLAGRARLRQATTAKELDRVRLADAAAEFQLVLKDPDASALHASTRGLLDRVALTAAPADRLRVLSAALGTAARADDQALIDYERLMDAAVGDTTSYEYDKIPNRVALAASDLNDWILVMQGSGAEAGQRALAQWKQIGSVPWLAAALWKATPGSSDAEGLLRAAERVDSTSPAFYTVAFLRIRLLTLRGRSDEARAALAALPSKPDTETANLLAALRFKLARSMDELLAAAPRRPVSNRDMGWTYLDERAVTTEPIFDDDAGVVFNERLPLARLVEASKSTLLPARLRMRVASAAFVRALMLKRSDEARAVAPILGALSRSVAADMRRYAAATGPEDSHIAGLRVLLRTPGLRAAVKGIEDDADQGEKELSREFDHLFRRNWWCGFDKGEFDRSDANSQILRLAYHEGDVPYPAFLSAGEIAAAKAEWSALIAVGPAPNYLAGEAVKWARARPTDLDAAEALAHAVEGTRWGCGDKGTTAASRTAFQTLHKLFPRSEWAQKTRYWY